jgi:hypothetical protein
MPRNLADVLHHFLPELDPAPSSLAREAGRPLLCVPVGPHDVVRTALVWNLAVEMARSGPAVHLVVPASFRSGSLWPPPGRGPLGVELHALDAADLAEFAENLPTAWPPGVRPAAGDALGIACIPPPWLEKALDGTDLLRWMLVLARPERAEQRGAYATLKRVARVAPGARLGVSICGAHSVADAEQVFARLALTVERHLDRGLLSYGLLVHDLDLCRSILNRHPIGLARPRSPAARALADVARLLLEDAMGAA